MVKLAIGIEYDGSQYHGWQKQPGLRTVQGVVEHALTQIARNDVHLTCAGRTDTGVHAMNQVAHFTTQSERQIKSWLFGSNSLLPKDVVLRWVKQVDDGFDARFSAQRRRYRYVILNQPVRPAHLRGCVTWHYQPLDTVLMCTEAQVLLGEQDFSSFQASQCQSKSPMRRMHSIVVFQHQQLVMVDVEADAFLHHMVRNIVGVLLRIGSGQAVEGWMSEVLQLRDRRRGGETAPAYGLYLYDVAYPQHFDIPVASHAPLFLDLPFKTQQDTAV